MSLLIFGLAIWFLDRELHSVDFTQVIGHIRGLSPGRVVAAVALAACSYLVLTGYDALALRYVGKTLAYGRTAMVAFMAYAVGHNVGIATLSGGSIRYRVYSTLGLSAAQIATIIVFCTVTFGLAAALLLGAALWLLPPEDLGVLHLPLPLLHVLAVLLLAVPIVYLLTSLLRRLPLRAGNWAVTMPRPALAGLQLILGSADLLFAAGTLYVLVATELQSSFPAFLGVYLIAMAAGLVSSVPGGVGVFESVLLLGLPGGNREALLGAILVYRLIYYVAPLGLAVGLLAGHEAVLQRARIGKAGQVAADWLSRITPHAVAVVIFLTGVVLLVSGSLPAVHSRLAVVTRLVPLPVLELSHLLGSLLGVALLLVARGLYRRLRGAYLMASALLVAGIVASMTKGLDFEEALILLAALGLLWLGRDRFHRIGSLLEQRFTPAWFLTILLALLGTVWVGLFSQRHEEYSNELWWQFSLNGNAPRMMRASLLAGAAIVVFALWQLMRPRPPVVDIGKGDALLAARRIVAGATEAAANAALIGDKRLLFNDTGSAFIMYQISGRSWIALGDPVGPQAEYERLAWEFRNLCDRFDAWPVFYQVSDRALPLYVDMGLTLSKLGEEAWVALADFSLQGSRRAELRQVSNRAKRAGAQFEIVPRQAVPALIPKLERVSNEWLADKAVAEKGFSLGGFSPEYLANFECAVVTIDEQVVAFANLWSGADGRELSVDLMRHNDRAPKGIMDYLFTELMLWGRLQRYERFSLGMAPLSGLEHEALAPLWHKLGNLIFQHGEQFYNFEGLRRYKDKFEPQWRPRYLACPGGFALPRVILDASMLISGGLRQIFRK